MIARAPAARSTAGVSSGGRVSSASAAKSNHNSDKLNDMSQQITELKVTVDGLEKERDFYFGKLREIEILVQEQLDMLDGQVDDNDCLKIIQSILYRTEEGFEVPPEGEGEEEDYDDETF